MPEADVDANQRRVAKTVNFGVIYGIKPFGLAALEAAQAGCALVLSDIATFRELWSDAATFVAAEDAAGFAAAVERLADDAALRGDLGRAARRRAGRYRLELQAGRMAEVYASLLHPAGAGSHAA